MTDPFIDRAGELAKHHELEAISCGVESLGDAILRVPKGTPNHPIGVVLLARLAVDESEKGAGLGRALLKDALVRSASAADIVWHY